MKRRLWAVLTALSLTLTLLPTAALAAEDGAADETNGDVAVYEAEDSGITSYAALKAAIEAADAGDTITLDGDILFAPTGTGTELQPQIIIAKDLTLDLSGYKIGYTEESVEGEYTYTPALLSIMGGATVTITGDGTVDAELGMNNSYGINVVEDSKLIVKSGNFYGATTAIQVEKGSLIAYGGNFDLAAIVKREAPQYAKYIVNCIDAAFKNGTAKIQLVGGTYGYDFSNNPEGADTTYLPAAYEMEEADGIYTVRAKAGNAAEVNGVEYVTLPEAVTAAEDGDTVTLLQNVALTRGLAIHKDLTLDLGGNTLSRAGGLVLDLYGETTLKNGKIAMTDTTSAASAVWVNQTAKLTVEDDAELSAPEGSFALAYDPSCTAAEVTLRGKITGAGSGVTMNGLITGSATANKLTVDGAEIRVGGHGIYQAGCAETAFTIRNAVITGTTGIEVRAGKLKVTNSTISGGDELICKPNGNGTTTDGAGIAIAQHTTKLPIDVQISGGEISGAYAIYESNPQGNDAASIAQVKLSVTDGKFTGKIYSEDVEGFINGGLFTEKVETAYCADGLAAVANPDADTVGMYPWTVGKVSAETGSDVQESAAAGATVGSVDESITSPEDRLGAQEVAESVTPTGTIADDNEISDADKQDALTELVRKNLVTLVDNKIPADTKVTVVKETYLEVQVTALNLNVADDSVVLSMNITPKYNLIAVAEKDGAKNQITLKTAQSMTVTEETEISVQLPAGIFGGERVYIDHNNGQNIYTALADSNGNITFKTKGFSPFTFTLTNASAAEADGTLYATLQEAVDAVQDGGTVTVLKDGLSAVASGDKTFTLTKDAGVTNVTLTAGAGYTLTNQGDRYTVAMKRSGGSGGGSSSGTTYTVTVKSAEIGGVTVSAKTAKKGETVTITLNCGEGCTLDTLTVKDANGNTVKLTDRGNGKYTFTMPGSNVTVTAKFTEEQTAAAFTDVPADAYYAKAVAWAVEKGVTNGMGNGLFGSNQPCTRAQIVTFLWRAAGSPEPKSVSTFTDVAADAYYAKAVAWAVENGITAGTGDGKFAPDATCTRAQSVTFLYRAAGKQVEDNRAEFGDVSTESYYADAVAWAVNSSVTNGIGNGLFGSNQPCTRAQIVTFLYRTYQGK